MKYIILLSLLLLAFQSKARDYEIVSPNGEMSAIIKIDEKITWELFAKGERLTDPSPAYMIIDDMILGREPGPRTSSLKRVFNEIKPVVRQKSAVIQDYCNQLTINFSDGYFLVFRMYDDAFAYRWETRFENELEVSFEGFHVCLPGDYSLLFPEEESMFTHQEREYLNLPVSEVTEDRFASMPLMIRHPSGFKMVVTEAGLRDYPGMFLSGDENDPFCLKGRFPYYPVETEQPRDRDEKVTKTASYMARTLGTREFPWRIIAVAEEDKDLLENQVVFKLSHPLELEDTDWIKPGKVAWDWWNANNVYHVDFEAGINTETYKYYIDFAARYGLEYIILDEGWYELGNLMQVSPDIDMESLISYAEEKNVGIILWVVWKTLDDQLEEALDQFEKWGIKGIKVDFMQRDDQWMVNYYWKIAEEAAKRKLLVDFHGSYKPTGLRRAYPNVMTREGVRGLEWSKWSDKASPEMAVTLPFIRMLAGPMDYTPGAMINATQGQFNAVYDKPMSQGTRCHQLAMYVIFESPLQMLADSPTHYLEEEECMDFLSGVPTTWDETIALDGIAGEYVVMARRSGNRWYLGAMTSWQERGIDVDLSFLKGTDFKMTIWEDGPNAHRNAEDFRIVETIGQTRSGKMRFHLAPGGGMVAVIVTQ